jgi:hypothetical protein
MATTVFEDDISTFDFDCSLANLHRKSIKLKVNAPISLHGVLFNSYFSRFDIDYYYILSQRENIVLQRIGIKRIDCV